MIVCGEAARLTIEGVGALVTDCIDVATDDGVRLASPAFELDFDPALLRARLDELGYIARTPKYLLVARVSGTVSTKVAYTAESSHVPEA